MSCNSSPRQRRHHLFEKFKTLRAEFRSRNRASSHVVAWICKCSDHAGLHRIDGVGEDHRDRGGGFFHGESGWCRHHYNDIDVKPNHLRCEIRELLGVALGVPPLDNKVSALFVPELPEPGE